MSMFNNMNYSCVFYSKHSQIFNFSQHFQQGNKCSNKFQYYYFSLWKGYKMVSLCSILFKNGIYNIARKKKKRFNLCILWYSYLGIWNTITKSIPDNISFYYNTKSKIFYNHSSGQCFYLFFLNAYILGKNLATYIASGSPVFLPNVQWAHKKI